MQICGRNTFGTKVWTFGCLALSLAIATAALLHPGGTADLNGYNHGRPVTTTCFTTGMITQCSSP
jgi:hypothetical protein